MNQSKRSANKPTRRRFLRHSVTAGLGIGCFTSSIALAKGSNSPNEKLNMAIIGAGGRGNANMGGVSRENIYALCDVNQAAIDKAKKRFANAKVVHDWRKLVDDPKVDAFVISTADHHHALAGVAAMRAGKHAYSEKPLAHTVLEARAMQDEYKKRRGKIATQMGTQIHATDNYRRMVELVQAGAIGPVKEAHVWCSRSIRGVNPAVLTEETVPDSFHWDEWLGPAPERPYNQGYWRGGNLNWNRRWEFGNGVLGDMGSHLIDLPWWALKLHRPLTVVSEGPDPDPVACPPWQVATWEHPAREGNPNLAVPVKVVWYHGPEGMKRRSDLLQPRVGGDTTINKWGIGVAFIGEKGVLVGDYGKHLLSPSKDFADYKRPEPTIPKSLGHHNEWIHACKTGGESLCNFDYSGSLIEHNLLGNVAHRAGKKLEWDAEKMKITNAPEAEKFLTKEYRKGWTL